MKQKFTTLYRDTLLRNSLYLMLATAVMAGFGFFFWLINARLFSAEQIGLATALISTMNLISLLSLVGFDTVLVRFLPKSRNRNELINTAVILVGLAAAALAAGFVFFMPSISPKLMFVRDSPWLSILFVFFCVTSAWNVLTDAVFLAYRRAGYTLGINSVFSFAKMLFPLAFVRYGAAGIFAAAGAASLLGFLLSTGALVRRFGYRPGIVLSGPVIREAKHYSGANYVAGLANLLPPTLLPLIITNRLGADQAAYFYIALMIANMLYVVPQATSKSLFAEGSHTDSFERRQMLKAARIITILMVPATLVLLLAAPFILNIFGNSYGNEGTRFLRIMALSGLAVGLYNVVMTIFKVSKNLRQLVVADLVYAAVIIGGSVLLLGKFGLQAVGWSWLAGHAVAGIGGLAWLLLKRDRNGRQPALQAR